MILKVGLITNQGVTLFDSAGEIQMKSKKDTLTDRFLNRLMNRKAIAIIVILAATVIGLGKFTDSVSSLKRAIKSFRLDPPSPHLLVEGYYQGRFVTFTIVNPPLAEGIVITSVHATPYEFSAIFEASIDEDRYEINLYLRSLENDEKRLEYGEDFFDQKTVHLDADDAASFSARFHPASSRLSEIWFVLEVEYVTTAGARETLTSSQAFRYNGSGHGEFEPRNEYERSAMFDLKKELASLRKLGAADETIKELEGYIQKLDN